jgi:putative hydrolase of the HAD superfamily
MEKTTQMKKIHDLGLSNEDLWVFDNDGTLYNDKVLQKDIEKLMDQFFSRMTNSSENDGKRQRKKLRKKHSDTSTIISLYREGFEIPYLRKFVTETYLASNKTKLKDDRYSTLTDKLSQIPGTKIILTNAPSAFAHQVLKYLEIDEWFYAVYGIEEIGFTQKPEIASFSPIIPFLEKGRRVFFVDDKINNVLVAISIGCVGMWWNGEKLNLVKSKEEYYEID